MDVASENHGEKGAAAHLWFEAALVAGRWAENVRLSVADGIITGVEPNMEPQASDERCAVGIPGLANLHSHAFQRGMAGLAEVRGPGADSFWTWREIMYHFLDRITPQDMEAIAAQAYVEMLESGFTRVGEFHYVHHDCDGSPYDNIGELAERICGAAQATGINLTLLPSFYAHSNFGGLNPTTGQRRFITSLDEFARLLESAARSARVLPGATVGVAPHSLRAVTPGELREIIALSNGRPIHIHAAEQVKEVEECVAATGLRPVEWLLENAPVDHRWCLIHATHMTPSEITGLARSGATVGLCPITEANLGDGVFAAAPFVAQGGYFGIGTDSNVHIAAADELRALEYSQRLTTRGRNVLANAPGASSGRSLFDMALAGGNRALEHISIGSDFRIVGRALRLPREHALTRQAERPPYNPEARLTQSSTAPEGTADGLSVGDPADIVALACDYESLTARERGDTIFDRLIFGGMGGRVVDSVWVGGKRVVANGRHVRRDEVSAAFRRSLRRVLSA